MNKISFRAVRRNCGHNYYLVADLDNKTFKYGALFLGDSSAIELPSIKRLEQLKKQFENCNFKESD